ncbi:MAG: hypothetical protein ACKVP5_06690 [Aestuariivirga sp.]
MFKIISRLALAAGLVFAIGTVPAMALCKYGTPHCINKNPGPKTPKVNTTTLPDSGWEDPDCAHYGNCQGSDWMGGGRTIMIQPPK